MLNINNIDAVIEIDNQYLILIEYKYEDAPIPTTQQLLLERLCDNWQGKSIALKVSHNSTEGKVPLSDCTVTQYYYQHQWHDRNTPFTTAIAQIAHNWGVEKLLPK